MTGVAVETITTLASWLGQSDGALAVPGGDDAQTYIAAYVLNAITGNLGRTLVFLENSPRETLSTPQNAAAVIQSIHNGDVDVVIVAGGANPAYCMPVSWNAGAALRRAPFVVWMGGVPDESSEAAHLMMPTHHPLETWRDSQPRAGVYQIGQPVMQPVFSSRPLHDILLQSAHLAAGAAKYLLFFMEMNGSNNSGTRNAAKFNTVAAGSPLLRGISTRVQRKIANWDL